MHITKSTYCLGITLGVLGTIVAINGLPYQSNSEPIVIQTPGAEERMFGFGEGGGGGGGGGFGDFLGFDFGIDTHQLRNMLMMMPWGFHLGYPPMPLVPPPMRYPDMMSYHGGNNGNMPGPGPGY